MAALATLSAAMNDQFGDITHWVFDLDNTLYPAECNLFLQVDRNIQQFIMDLFDLPPDEARKLQKSYFHEHGTTLNGLMAKHGIEPEEFLEFVHDIDVTPVPRMRRDGDVKIFPSGQFTCKVVANQRHARPRRIAGFCNHKNP